MERYAAEARARADEILSLLAPEERTLLWEWCREPGNIDWWDIIHHPSKRVQTILSQTPAKDQEWVSRTPRPTFLREWIAARHWALAAANALEIAAALEDVKGLRPYRKGVRAAAQAAQSLPLQHDPEETILGQGHEM